MKHIKKFEGKENSYAWKPIEAQTLDSISGGVYILVCIEDTDHIDMIVKHNGVWKYCYSGKEVQDMKKYTHYFIPRPLGLLKNGTQLGKFPYTDSQS